METYDLVVVGAGPGGYVAAIRAAQLGMRVAVVEKDRAGGVCLNWGCIPSKAILHAAELYESVRDAESLGLRAEGLGFDYGGVIAHSRKAADRLAKGVESLFRKHGIVLVPGEATLETPQRVRVCANGGSRTLEGKHVLLATGSTERTLPGLDVDGRVVLTSRQALESRRFPRSLLVIGGGAVGVEFAYVYAAFGAQVTIVEMEEQLLPGTDRDVAKELERAFQRRKVVVKTRTRYKECRSVGENGAVVAFEGPEGELELRAEQVLVAVGRAPLSGGLGLEELGVEVERGFVRVDERFRTKKPELLAVGDVVGAPLLAHKASEEGIAAVEFLAGERSTGVDYDLIPSCVYCQPEVATVGLTEEEARRRGFDVKVGRFPFTASGKAVATGHREGFVKVVVDARYGEILGGHIVGRGATELISQVGLAKFAEATVTELGTYVRPHPTLSEAIMEAALAVEGRSINF
ncbi:MAG: dihydrolipoyl dehydrogenase [Candidatus Binatia bacterium]|nr:MAG: dihydrolipoyl dehydrogenase [Candidatus Binatia bacterium]